MNKEELEFRRQLCERMAGKWTPTIHVENHLNPGVPDMSYVMSALNCETGWLELKVSDGTRVKVEPGQHAWMRAHAERIPAHFLIKVDQTLFLVRGRTHHLFADPITIEELKSCSVAFFQWRDTARYLSLALISETRRNRNDS